MISFCEHCNAVRYVKYVNNEHINFVGDIFIDFGSIFSMGYGKCPTCHKKDVVYFLSDNIDDVKYRIFTLGIRIIKS